MSKVTDKIDEKTNQLKDYSTGNVVQPMKGYDPNVDYEARIQQNIKDGYYVSAAQNERIRNLKIADTGLPYAPTNRFNYQDGTQFAKENLLSDIKDYNKKGFTYNPENDAVYQSLDQRYKQQALDNYNDNITSLARQYGGEIPAYLKQIAKNSYQTEAGKANDAIPTLSQMALEKWGDTRNDMYNQYGLLDAQESKDYNKFIDNRNFITGAADNLYGRNITERQMANSEKEYAANENFAKGNTIFDWMKYYSGLGYGAADAERMAKESYANFYGGYIPQRVSGGSVSGTTASGNGGTVVPTKATVVEDEDAPGYITIEDILNLKK